VPEAMRPRLSASPRALAVTALALAAGIAVALVVAGRAQTPTLIPREAYDHPGQLVTLPDGRRLNFRCVGEGSPTVILEAGFSSWSFAWGKVQARLAPVTRACAYDRAGYGFSDPGPLPRDGAAIARDLDRGLRAAHINGPYVLVGHSAGGLYQRLFAARRRSDVVGLVFVDSSVEHQTEKFAAMFGRDAGNATEGMRRKRTACLEIVQAPAQGSEAERTACEAFFKPGPPGLWLKPAVWNSEISELDTLFDKTSEQVDRTDGLLKDIPAIVLTAGDADGAPEGPQDPGAQAWQLLHKELAGRFTHSREQLVKSGHLMMNERPEVISAAALELVAKARKRRP